MKKCIKQLQVIAVLIFLTGCGNPSVKKTDSDLGYKGSKQNSQNPVFKELNRLKANPNSKIRVEDGWTIIQEGHTHWSFAPEKHDAFPAFAKRKFVDIDGYARIQMSVTCGAKKVICDKFVNDLKKLNETMRQSFIKN